MDLWIYGHQASILWIYLSASIADSPKKFSTAFLAGRRRCHIYTSTCHQIYSKSFILLNVFINSSVALKLRFTFNLWICFSPSFIYSYTPTSLYEYTILYVWKLYIMNGKFYCDERCTLIKLITLWKVQAPHIHLMPQVVWNDAQSVQSE